jgi:CheY-like chemotaxis protein
MDTEEGQAAGRPPKRVLVADDNQDAADSLALVLEMVGCDVRAVYDGQQAVEAVQEFQPDIVILDINMPVMDGYQAARTIRSTSGQRTVLVAMTGAPGWETAAQARDSGFDAHFGKPVGFSELQRVLDLGSPLPDRPR